MKMLAVMHVRVSVHRAIRVNVGVLYTVHLVGHGPGRVRQTKANQERGRHLAAGRLDPRE